MSQKKIIKIVLVILFLFNCTFSNAQDNNNEKYRKKYRELFYTQPDSAYFYINKLKNNFYKDHDTIKAQDYNNFSYYYLYKNEKDSAIYYLKKSLKLASDVNKPKTLFSLGIVYKKAGNFEKAISIFESVIHSDITTLEYKAKAYSEIASTYSLKSDFDKCKFYFVKAIEISEKIKDSVTLNINKINFANFYKKNNLSELALPLYQEALTFYKSNINSRNYFLTVINLAGCYERIDKSKKGLELLNTIEFTKLKGLSDNSILATYFSTKAQLLMKLEPQNKTIDTLYTKSLNYAKASQDSQFMMFYNKYLEYLIELRATNKINRSIKEYNIDSAYKKINLMDKHGFMNLLSQSNLDIKFNKIDGKELNVLKDSLFNTNSKIVKDELLLNYSNLKKTIVQSDKLKTNKNIILYFTALLFGIMVYLIYKFRSKFKSISISTKNNIDSVKKTHYKSLLKLKKEVIEFNLERSINNEKQNFAYWNKFKEKLKNLDPEFITTIKNYHPELTPSELDLCSFIKLNMSNKEIAELLKIEYRSVVVKKYRLKKKLKIADDLKIEKYIYLLTDS
ncbi:tetratricopeptide repeat protein [Flavobacterium sp. W22_SRS_FP1]|uniref:tetratricopeptide repeat protein n=1 Tax=Flavobacterium sp. W22_SRS_FP1 TaxID=3240276 RepID=UPI003F903595